MTKPQEPSEVTWKVTKSKKPTYTTFYLVLLILLTISTIFGLFGLGSIDDTIASIRTQPLLGYITLAQYAVTIAMAVGLIFLYKKDKRGLILVLSGYGAAVIFSLLFLISRDSLVQDVANQIVSSGSNGTARITQESATQIANTIFILIPILNAFASILFGTLWYFAWKKQAAVDAKDSAKSDA